MSLELPVPRVAALTGLSIIKYSKQHFKMALCYVALIIGWYQERFLGYV